MTRKNKVPEHQKFYQTAYRNHERVWKIVSWEGSWRIDEYKC